LDDDVVVGVVAGVEPVVDQRAEHGAAFPPVIGVWEVAWNLAGLVTVVVGEHVIGEGFGCGFDGVCDMCLAVSGTENGRRERGKDYQKSPGQHRWLMRDG